MISAIKFGTAQFLTSNPPANTVVLAFDFDDKQLYLMDSEQRVLLSDVITSFLFGPDGKIKPEFIESGAIVEVPTKTSQLINDSGYVTKMSQKTLRVLHIISLKKKQLNKLLIMLFD